MEIEKIVSYLKENLSDYRFNHTMGVANTAKELAKVYGIDAEKAYIAGLLHDCAKELPLTKMLKIVERNGIEIDEITKSSTALMHGIAGACLSKELFNCDSEIFDAISYHTTGKADMSIFTKIVYIADYIEPGRKFSGVSEIRQTAFENIDKAIIAAFDATIVHTVNKGGVIHPDTVEARNYLLMNNRGVAENEKIR